MPGSAADNDRDERDEVDFVPTDELIDRTRADGGAKPLELQEMYDLLADPRRRRVVEYIAERGEADISDITDHVASLEIGDNASGQPRKRVYIGIYQNHLPALVEKHVLERFDRSYRPGPNFEQLLDVIAQVEGVYETHAGADVEADDVDENNERTEGDGSGRPIPPDEPLDDECAEADGGGDPEN
jgi:hypothetical protein